MNWLLGIILVIILLVGLGLALSPSTPETPEMPTSTPPVTTPTTTATNSTDISNLIVVDAPKASSTVASKFEIKGKARGNWYFEASFPAEIKDKSGKQIWIAPVQAQGEWMTTEFVPFVMTADLGTYKGPATLILSKDNPSGLPEYDASVSIPLVIQ